MPKRNRFQSYLYEGDLADTASYLGVSKTTIREWRSGRAFPHPLRHRHLIRMLARRGARITAADMTRSAK